MPRLNSSILNTATGLVALMRNALKFSVRTVFYSSVFFALVALPQLLAHSVGAPVYM